MGFTLGDPGFRASFKNYLLDRVHVVQNHWLSGTLVYGRLWPRPERRTAFGKLPLGAG